MNQPFGHGNVSLTFKFGYRGPFEALQHAVTTHNYVDAR